MDSVHRLVRINAAEVDAFARLADDYNPIHMDDVAARAANFGGRICHGALLTSIISGMIAHAFPGAVWMEHNIQFKRPALVGQTFEFVLSLDETIKKPTKTLGIVNVTVHDAAGNLLATSRNVVLLPARAEVSEEPSLVETGACKIS